MEYVTTFLVLMLINAVILAVALIVGLFMQSFQIGVVPVFAAKAAGLLAVVSLVWLMPVGFWLWLVPVIWFLGFWLALGIGPRESLILVGVVFALSILVRLFLWALIMHSGGGLSRV